MIHRVCRAMAAPHQVLSEVPVAVRSEYCSELARSTILLPFPLKLPRTPQHNLCQRICNCRVLGRSILSQETVHGKPSGVREMVSRKVELIGGTQVSNHVLAGTLRLIRKAATAQILVPSWTSLVVHFYAARSTIGRESSTRRRWDGKGVGCGFPASLRWDSHVFPGPMNPA